MSDRPPHPGSRPSRLEFPSDQAAAAIDHLESLADQVDDLRRRMGQDMDTVNDGPFEGMFATWFNERGGVLTDELFDLASTLRADADRLTAHRAASLQSVAARADRIDDWNQDMEAWNSWEPDQ